MLFKRPSCLLACTCTRASEGTQYWGAEGILCGVMKLKDPIFAKGREYGNMLSQENLSFRFEIAFCVILHQ